jgi:hypothetical protein
VEHAEKVFAPATATARAAPPYQQADVEWTSDQQEVRMFRKSLLALAAVAALGTAALAPTGAAAHWDGYYRWHGSYHYQPHYAWSYHCPRYVWGGWKFGWRRTYGYC